MSTQSKQSQAIVFRLLDKNPDISAIAKKVGHSRKWVYQAIRQRFPNARDAKIPKVRRLEVELEKDEDPRETVNFYKNLKYRQIGAYEEADCKVLIFSR